MHHQHTCENATFIPSSMCAHLIVLMGDRSSHVGLSFPHSLLHQKTHTAFLLSHCQNSRLRAPPFFPLYPPAPTYSSSCQLQGWSELE